MVLLLDQGTQRTLATTLCEQLSVGAHRVGALDADGKVIVEGTFTVKS